MKTVSPQKRADLIAGLGAVILGIGIGALPALRLQRDAASLLFAGVLIHGWRMFDKHRFEKANNASNDVWRSKRALLDFWALLGALVVYVILTLLRGTKRGADQALGDSRQFPKCGTIR